MPRRWLSTVPAALLLVAVLLHGTSEKLHARFLQVGELVWTDYAGLRTPLSPPTCDTPAGKPAAAPQDDLLDDLLGKEEVSADSAAKQAAAARQSCDDEKARYAAQRARVTRGLRAFLTVEGGVSQMVHAGMTYAPHVLVLLLLLCAATATATKSHLSIRPIRTLEDHRASALGQLAANLALLVSSFFKWRVDATAGIEVQNASLPLVWIAGFAVLAGLNVWQLLHRPTDRVAGGKWWQAGLAAPLYAVMALIAAAYFFGVERHPSGLAIYLQKLTEHSILYIHVGLYIWAGMLLKQTRVAPMFFDVVRAWRLPPELLAVVIVVASALPTAYSGASGIFVMAAGAVIYAELRKAGAGHQHALAATAMCGSMGVVLSPCLLVVIIAALNKQVTTTQLYGWGWGVYGLTAALLLVVTLVSRRGKLALAPWGEAARGMATALRALLPYALIAAGVLLAFRILLSTGLDEHSAPTVLPLLLLLLLFYDRRRQSGSTPGKTGDTLRVSAAVSAHSVIAETRSVSPVFRRAVSEATAETTGHIGALLLLMGLSIGLGGVVERSGLMDFLPASFGSPVITMGALVAILMVVGMIMDPYGAVILVSVAVAQIAYRNGIDPVHFWMVVLVAFELGYLMPPIALNHLLTRRVVSVHVEATEPEPAMPGTGFWQRYERLLFPIAVMATALLIVAFAPLWWY